MRLEVAVAIVLSNQVQILERLDHIQLTLGEAVTSNTPVAPAQDTDA